ncbi:hypothetical protein DBR32_04125 [Taibaiella sp. KBW10]|uniref:lysylphosphatidylglycerol synthase domain-containing protein n=1 Tax=Taibaiella sp. KBW10 TaxID=2153357 RepID=UPI000F5A95CA|nr:lysylphosphatidylglycerol synthase domain-containing protein [Taibaiella sp. KBW10]RQO31995.1 hypothetical protein DBR32_04125 [Taibaiella sp. KBW10]
MNKITKKIWLNYIFAPALLVLLLFLIYKQVMAKGDMAAQWQALKAHLNPETLKWFVLVLLLAPLNWTLEALKWQRLLSRITPVRFTKAFASMLTGMAFSLVTPNRVGDFAGRILHVQNRYKLKAAIASMIGSIAQMCITASFGIAGLIYYNLYFGNTLSLVLLGLAVLLAFAIIWFYLRIDMLSRLATKYRWLRRVNIALRVLRNYRKADLGYILLLAFGRFLIYNGQFLLLVNILGAAVPWGPGFLMSALMFWTLAVVPSIAMLELGVRGYAGMSLFVTTGLTAASLPILSGSYMLWVINLVLPALLGSVLILGLRLGKRVE